MKKCFALILMFVAPICLADTVTFNLPFNQLFGKKNLQPDDSDLAFLAPQTAAYQSCLEALGNVPVVAKGEVELNATWSNACNQPFNENYKKLFGDCDQQRMNNKQWGAQTRQFISLLSSCEGDTAEKRRTLFSASVQNARTQRDQVFQRIDAINERIRIAEQQAREEERRVLAEKRGKEHARLRNEMYRAFERGGYYQNFAGVQQLYSCQRNGNYSTLRGNIFQVLERIIDRDDDCCALQLEGKKNRNVVWLQTFTTADLLQDVGEGKIGIADALEKMTWYTLATTPSSCPND